MIVNKVIGNVGFSTSPKIIAVPFEWFELDKKRILKVADDGTEIGIQVEKPLTEGDVLACLEDKTYCVRILPSKLIKAKVESTKEMGRLCFELGNRHLSLQINTDSVITPYDEPTFEYLKHLGFNATCVEERFTNYIVCKAHGNHSHDEHHEHHHSEQ